uniref:proliferation marker protein Ki-67 isoform X2 n=1 Tax=Pristiophorus japonicus TaxID=55135 RepID=UPI00398E9282
MPLYGKIIVIKRTGTDGYNFPLTSSSCLFGRKTDCDIRIQLPHVSKEHCKLEVNENNEVILTNLSEVNRTCLNGKVVLYSERLKHRDVFTVIDRSFRFEYPLDSVYNTSPRKKRSLSNLKNETLQEVDDGSQPSGKGRRSTSGHKSANVDNIFEAPTKSAKSIPNGREDPAPKSLRRRSSTKILNDEQPADQGYLSPFSKLYEMFKQQATKPIHNKVEEINMHVSVKESSTEQTSVPAKESDVMVSQYGENSRASHSARRTSGRMSKIRPEEGKMANDEEMSNPETRLVEDIATADHAKPADPHTPKKKSVSVELNKFTENLCSEANVTSLAFSDVGVKGKEQNNHLSIKGTPKAKPKSQHFTTRRSLTADEALKKLQESFEPSVEKEQSMVVKSKTVEMEHTPVNVGKEKTQTPKKRGRTSLCNKNVEAADVQAEQTESTNVSEPTAANSQVEDKSVGMVHAPVVIDEKKTKTPKKHGRPSLLNKNIETADVQAEKSESAKVLPSSAAVKSEVEDKSVEMQHRDTPKKRGRTSLCNKNVEAADVQAEQTESTNVSEPTAANPEVEMVHAPVVIDEEKAKTPKKRGRPSLCNKNVEAADVQAEQAESTNVSEPTAENSEVADKSVGMVHAPVVIDEKKTKTPKKHGRPSLRNKNIETADVQAERSESAEVLPSSAAVKSEVEDKSVEMQHRDTPKKRGRPSLRIKNVQTTDIQAEQADSAKVLEPSAATKSPALIKQKSGTSPSSLHLLSKRRESDAPEYLTKAQSLEKKSLSSKSPQQDLTNEQIEKTELVQEMFTSTILPRRHSQRLSVTSLAGEDHIGPMNTAAEQLEKSSLADVELDLYTSGKESPSTPAAVPYLSKKRRSESVEHFYGPSFKRKRVSFGANLSPEVFDKRMPASSPLRKGGTPTRVSTPFRCTSRVLLKRGSSIGIHTCTIQEFSELNEKYPRSGRSNVPSAGASPRQTKKSPAKIPSPGKRSSLTTDVKSPAKKSPAKKSPSDKALASTKAPSLVNKQSPAAKTPSLPSIKRSPAARTPSQSEMSSSTNKKLSVAKKSPTLSPRKLVTNKMSSPIAAGSFDCLPHVRGRFSISHVATPPILPQSMSSQQKASLVATSGKKPSRKSTRKSASLLSAIRSRRQSGASAANLLVSKSWAQVVKEGVARPQLRCAGKKSAVTQKRTKNIVSSKVAKTPIRLVKGHFSTGHAASPATIVIGKSQAATIKPNGQAPRIVRTVSLRRKDYDMDESFTGITDMFSTPTNERANPVLCTSNIVDDAQTALAIPISQKSFEDSVIKTPAETGVMAVSPLTISATRSRGYNNSVSRLLKCRADFSSSSNDICESIPKVKGKPVDDMVGVQRIMKTPRVKEKPVVDMVGIQRIMKTPRVKGKPVEDMVGVQRIMKTPRVKGKPIVDMVGVQRIMKTPRVKGKPVKNFAGLHKLMAEPKQNAESPEISYVGIKKMFQTEKERESCDYSGLGEMFSTPIRTERNSDSEQQQSSKRSASKRATNKPSTPLEMMYGDGLTTETSENKLIQIVEQHVGQPSTTKTPPRGTGCSASLAPEAEVTRTKRVQTKSSKEECTQQPDQPESSQIFPKDGHDDFTEREIAESKDGQAIVNKLVSPTRKSLKEKKEIQTTDTEESPTTKKSTTSGKNRCPDEHIEVSKMVSTRKSLKGEKIQDVQGAFVKTLHTPNKTTPGRKESLHLQTEEIIALKPQTRRSLKEMHEIQDVELQELPASIKGKQIQDVPDADVKVLLTPNKTTPGKKEYPSVQTEEIIALKPQTRRSLKENDEIQSIQDELQELPASIKGKQIQDVPDADVKTLLTPSKTTPGKKESPHVQTEEIIALKSQTRRSLKEKDEIQSIQDELEKLPASIKRNKIQDADVKTLLTANKTTPGKKESPHVQTEEIIALKPQTRRSLKDMGENQSIQDVELEGLSGSERSTSSKNETPGKKIEEVNKLVSPIIKSLRGKKVQNVHSAEMKELFTFHKATLDKKGSQDEQIGEVITSPVRKSLEGKKETQNVQEVEVISPPTSAKTQDKKQKSTAAQIEELVHLTSGKKPQRRKKETESSHVTEVKESPAVAKISRCKRETQHAQIEELDNSSLRKMSPKKNEIENVESGIMKNGLAPPKTSIKDTEKVKDLPVEDDVKTSITTGRPQRRKNINVETEAQKNPGTTSGSTRKRGARCARVENVKESICLQSSLKDQEEVVKAEVNSGPEGSEKEGVKTENIKILEKKELASSKYRSTRGKRAIKDLPLEEFKPDSVPAKRLRKEEELDEALSKKTVHWDSNLKLAYTAVETLQEMFNGTELPVPERRSRRGKAAKEEVNPLGSVQTSSKVSKHANSKVISDANKFLESAKQQKERPKRKETDVPCESQEFTKKDYCEDTENVNEGTPVMKMHKKETNQSAESVIKLSPTPIKRLLRGKVGQKVSQNKDNVRELSSRKSKRNTTEQKLMAARDEELHIPVKMPSSKEEKRKMTEEEYMPSSRTKTKGKKGKQAKESLVESEAVPEQTEQPLNVATVDVQLDTSSERVLQKNEPTPQKVKRKVGQRAKASAKRTLACLSNVEGVAFGEMAMREKRTHLNVPVGGSEVVNSDITHKTEATKQTKGKVTKARASDVTNDTKKMDVVSSHGYEIKENTRPKRSVRKGRSAKEIATKSEVKSLVPDTAMEIAERCNLTKRASKESIQTEEEDAQKPKSESKKLPVPAIKCSKRKIAKKDASSVVQEIFEEELQIKDEVVDPVKAPRKGDHGMVKRNLPAVITQELSIGMTENKQVIESSANKAENNKRTRRRQNCYDKGTAILSVAQIEKDELINKRGRRAILEVRTNSDENVQSRKDEVEDKGKEQETGFLSVESSKPAKRATRANKFCEAAEIEPILVQPQASASLTTASLCPSKRTSRGKRAVAETTTDVSPKKSKMGEKVTGKVTTEGRKTGKAAAVSTKKSISVAPEPAKPTGRTTRSRK